jgi:3-hydroxy-9,10-secoandrosta-1,3,5(10)-triene-9,17-dione monooxygenase
VVAEDTRPIDIVSALVPITDYRTVASWDAVGLRGAGSNDIHVDKKFVPNYRTLRNYDVALRRGPGQKINAGPLYRMPFGTMFNSAYTVPIIGVAESCLAAYLELMRDRSRLSLGGVNLPTDQAAQVAVARAGSEIDAADLQLSRNLRDMYERARRRHDISMDLRLRARRDQVLAAERAVTAIDLVFAAARGMALRRATPIERAWRNAHTGSAHAANDVASSLALCGRGLFGLPVDDMLV